MFIVHFFCLFFFFVFLLVGNPFSVYYDPFLVAAAQQVQAQAAAANSMQAAQVDPNYHQRLHQVSSSSFLLVIFFQSIYVFNAHIYCRLYSNFFTNTSFIWIVFSFKKKFGLLSLIKRYMTGGGRTGSIWNQIPKGHTKDQQKFFVVTCRTTRRIFAVLILFLHILSPTIICRCDRLILLSCSPKPVIYWMDQRVNMLILYAPKNDWIGFYFHF